MTETDQTALNAGALRSFWTAVGRFHDIEAPVETDGGAPPEPFVAMSAVQDLESLL